MDGSRLAATFRALRVRRGWRQIDLAERAEVSRGLISLVERGHLEAVTFGALSRVAVALDARLDTSLRWHGGDLPALVNGRHSAMHEAFARWTGRLPTWQWTPEVSFSRYGERGVLDVLGWHEPSGVLLVGELKSELVDVQEALGTLDRKTRLATVIARERGLAVSGIVGSWLMLAPSRTNARRVADHRALLRAALPDDLQATLRWLRAPDRRLRAFSYLPDANQDDLRRRIEGPRRVRRRSPSQVVPKPSVMGGRGTGNPVRGGPSRDVASDRPG